MTHYTASDPLEMDEICIVPHYAIEIETSREDWGLEITKTATLDYVAIHHVGERDGIDISRSDAVKIWGEKTICAWEESAADKFDASQALADEADDYGDYLYEQWRDDNMEAA